MDASETTVSKINEVLPAHYPRLLRLSIEDDCYLAWMKDRVLYLSLDDMDYMQHFQWTLDRILLPKIIDLLDNGVVYE